MYVMLSGLPMTNYLIRGALPSLIPLIAAAEGWTQGQVVILLSSFYPGYLSTQVPSGWAAQRYGGKGMLTANCVGSAACLFLAPRLAMRGMSGHWGLAWVFFVMGACQGPLMPAKSALQQAWLPQGVERVWATRFMSLGGRLAQLLAVWATPRIGSVYGWRTVCYVYGAVTAAMSVMWHLIARNAPLSSAEGKLSALQDTSKAVEWGIFRMRSAQSVIASHVAFNNSNYTLDQWAPLYFVEVFGLEPIRVGQMLSVPLAMSSMIGNVVVGVAESVLLKRGMDLLAIRKKMSWIGHGMQGSALVLFALSPSPFLALVGYFFLRLGQCFHGSGANASYLEVGGQDTAVLMAVGNTLATVPGAIAPPLKMLLMRLTGCQRLLSQPDPTFWLSAACAVEDWLAVCLNI